MKWIKFTAVAVLTVVGTAQGQVEKPRVMDEAMLSISLPNVHGFLNEVGLVAANVQPGMNGGMLKMMLGMQLGDMNLAGIPATGGLSIVAMDPTNIFAVIEVSEPQSSAYLNMAVAKGLQAKYVNGTVVLAKEAAVLEKVSGKAGAVKSALLSNNASVLSVAMQPATMIERNREAIDGFMQMMPAMLGMSMMQQPGASLDSTESITKILQAELAVLLSISEQCSFAEIKLTPKSGSIVLSETFVPLAGTPLANLVNAPEEKKENPKLHAGILGDGTIKMDMLFASPKAFADFVSLETKKVAEVLQLEGVDSEALKQTMARWIEIFSGTGCEVVAFDEDRLKMRYVMEVSDETKALEVLRSMDKDMLPFLKMYEGMGMPMTMEFKENVRESDGVKIHEFTTKVDLSSMIPEQKEQMAAMGMENMTYDLAVADGIMFYSEKDGMETLIKKVKSGTDAPKIAARSTYPEGGFYYLDMDIGEYMAFSAQTMPDDPSTAAMKQQMGTMFIGTEPITSAGFKKDGMVHWSVTVPGDLIAKYGQMIIMSQMPQQQMGAPAAAPPAPASAPPAAQ